MYSFVSLSEFLGNLTTVLLPALLFMLFLATLVFGKELFKQQAITPIALEPPTEEPKPPLGEVHKKHHRGTNPNIDANLLKKIDEERNPPNASKEITTHQQILESTEAS